MVQDVFQDVPEEGRFGSTAANTGKMYRDRYFKQSVLDALAIVEPVAKKHNIPLIEVALRWCVHHSQLKMKNKGGEDGIILGVSSYDQLVQNVEACEKGELPADVVEALDKAFGQAWFDGVRSIADPRYNGGADRLPLWIITYWKDAAAKLKLQEEWVEAVG